MIDGELRARSEKTTWKHTLAVSILDYSPIFIEVSLKMCQKYYAF